MAKGERGSTGLIFECARRKGERGGSAAAAGAFWNKLVLLGADDCWLVSWRYSFWFCGEWGFYLRGLVWFVSEGESYTLYLLRLWPGSLVHEI